MIFLGANLLPREEFIRLAESRLAVRPVLVEWHRAYQNTVEGKPEGRDLVARYRTMVEQEPENSVLLYLLSRVAEDLDESIATLQRAAALPHPTGYAFFGLAYRHVLDGEFRLALESVDEALRLDPGNVQFQAMRVSALYGLKEFATVEAEVGNLMKSPDADLTAFYEHIYRLAKLGESAVAKEEIAKFIVKLAISPERVPFATAYLESALAIATRDRAVYLDRGLARRTIHPGHSPKRSSPENWTKPCDWRRRLRMTPGCWNT